MFLVGAAVLVGLVLLVELSDGAVGAVGVAPARSPMAPHARNVTIGGGGGGGGANNNNGNREGRNLRRTHRSKFPLKAEDLRRKSKRTSGKFFYPSAFSISSSHTMHLRCAINKLQILVRLRLAQKLGSSHPHRNLLQNEGRPIGTTCS